MKVGNGLLLGDTSPISGRCALKNFPFILAIYPQIQDVDVKW